MRRECIKVQVQAVAGEDWDAAGNQPLVQRMHGRVCGGLSAGAQMQDWDNFSEWVNSQPQPEGVCTAPQPGANLVQLHMRQLEMEDVAYEGCLTQTNVRL